MTFGYETLVIDYEIPASKHTYRPDFPCLTRGKITIILETKGLFQRDDRRKMQLVKLQHPELDIRMVFSNANAKIAKGSPTTYAKWCDTNGIRWAHRKVPDAWITELLA